MMMRDVETAYQAALDYLYSFIDYSLTHSSRYAQARFNLERMEAFLKLLGEPHRQYPVIHVAGTKGKGSTAAMMASSLLAAGYRVGLYSSPHLQEYTERLQVNGQPIEKGELAELVETIKPLVAQVEHLTTFEITTALGFLHFANQKVDAAIIEVGMGGRLDATNVVNPLVSVITSLSMDHMGVLGDTLPKIAFEKAGIIKLGRPVVLAVQRDDARQVIEQVAGERGCPLVEIGRDYQYAPGSHSLKGQTFQVWKSGDRPQVFSTPLLGLHQVENAATAYAALRTASEHGLRVTNEDMRKGFASVSWPGRFEVLRAGSSLAPAAGDLPAACELPAADDLPAAVELPVIIIDSAHNRDSALRLRQALDDYLPGRPVVLVFGASEDKDIEGMFTELMPRVSVLIATQSIHPRAAPADRLVEIAQPYGRPADAVVPVEKALQAAIKAAREYSTAPNNAQPAVILVSGSIFVAAAVRDIWKTQQEMFEV